MMTIPSPRHPLQILTLALLCSALGACSSAPERSNQQRSEPFGEAGATRGSTEVTTERQVVVTERTDVPTVVTQTRKADINRMEPRHFVALGFPEDQARAIVHYRDEHGEFASVDQLASVPGLNPEILRARRDQLGASRSG